MAEDTTLAALADALGYASEGSWRLETAVTHKSYANEAVAVAMADGQIEIRRRAQGGR